MTIGIVTDSSCDLPLSLVKEHHITIVPLYINIGDKSYQDGVDLSRNEFYENLPNYPAPPKTSAPGPDIFRETYQMLANSGVTEILSIHISKSLSAIVDSAIQAAKEFTTIPVTVLDSRQLSMGTGFLALTAARLAEKGKSMNEILGQLEDQISRTFTFAALSTIEFLKRSGRMNGVAFLLGNFLQIKPILRMFDGKPTSERIRTHSRAVQRMSNFLKNIGALENVAIMHSHAQKEADQLIELFSEYLTAGPKLCVEITPVIGSHIGPGALGFVCIAKTKPAKIPWD